MRGISSGLAGGSSLALAWKALSVLDRPPADPLAICEALSTTKSGGLDWFSFCAGLVCGVIILAFVELAVTLRWLLVSLIHAPAGARETAAAPQKGAPAVPVVVVDAPTGLGAARANRGPVRRGA